MPASQVGANSPPHTTHDSGVPAGSRHGPQVGTGTSPEAKHVCLPAVQQVWMLPTVVHVCAGEAASFPPASVEPKACPLLTPADPPLVPLPLALPLLPLKPLVPPPLAPLLAPVEPPEPEPLAPLLLAPLLPNPWSLELLPQDGIPARTATTGIAVSIPVRILIDFWQSRSSGALFKSSPSS